MTTGMQLNNWENYYPNKLQSVSSCVWSLLWKDHQFVDICVLPGEIVCQQT